MAYPIVPAISGETPALATRRRCLSKDGMSSQQLDGFRKDKRAGTKVLQLREKERWNWSINAWG